MVDRAGLVLETVEIFKGDTRLLAIDTHVRPGEVLSVMGPSGAGKSTLLSYITGSLAPDFNAKGAVRLDGRVLTSLAPEHRRIGLLFQDDLLFPHLNVAENLAFGLASKTRGRAARRQLVEAALEEIGLEGYGPRDPATLSGGQKARVSLMRMLLSKPKALLLDEPFSRLDTDLRDQIRAMVFTHAARAALPVIMVTHDQADAEAAGGDIIQLNSTCL